MAVQMKEAIRFTKVCNLIETLWAQRLEDNYYDVDFDDLLPMTSPQARKIAGFVDDLYAE